MLLTALLFLFTHSYTQTHTRTTPAQQRLVLWTFGVERLGQHWSRWYVCSRALVVCIYGCCLLAAAAAAAVLSPRPFPSVGVRVPACVRTVEKIEKNARSRTYALYARTLYGFFFFPLLLSFPVVDERCAHEPFSLVPSQNWSSLQWRMVEAVRTRASNYYLSFFVTNLSSAVAR